MRNLLLVLPILHLAAAPATAQMFDEPDRGQPGDIMIRNHLCELTERLSTRWLAGVETADDWQRMRPRLLKEYFYMLGLDPMPERTPLHAVVTRTLDYPDFSVELVHFQSRPHLYVAGNLYRPRRSEPGKRLPAVFYVCGHAGMGRNGNKTAFQDFGIWFARHGYVCLAIDSLQLGEIEAIHHGTYKYERWWWHSRGYTPAGVECWNGIRALDYLCDRPDVDPKRIAVTGASGGGAASFWIAAADERIAVAVPCMGMADLESYIVNRTINGHCDCMFLYNTFEWPWTHIAALIAPRPLLFVNSNQDVIFPMDANNRISNRLEQLYCLFGMGDMVDSVVSVGPHDYRRDIRQAVYRFINTHFNNDARLVTDSEADLVINEAGTRKGLIPMADLRVFPTDADIPKDQLNTRIDESFVPVARVELPGDGDFEAWKQRLTDELRRVSFRLLPQPVPAAVRQEELAPGTFRVETEWSVECRMRIHRPAQASAVPSRSVLVVVDPQNEMNKLDWLVPLLRPGDSVFAVEPRGLGQTRWTRKNPPNYVERSHVLLGRTVDAARVWDVIAVARRIQEGYSDAKGVHLVGRGAGGVLAAYAGLWEPTITGVTAVDPPMTHMDPKAPAILNVMRVCDIPEVFGMLAPRPLTLLGVASEQAGRVEAIYRAAGAADRLTLH